MGGLFVRELPATERPRERLVTSGPASLSNRELLAVVLLSGGRDESVLDLAGRLLMRFDGRLRRLLNADVQELLSVDGVGMAKACQMKAVGELSRRMDVSEARTTIASPRDAALRLIPRMRDLDREELVVLPLDVKNNLIDGTEIIVSVGSLDGSSVRPRDIYRVALLKNAASIVLAHNHPSGDPEPSGSDIAVSRRISEVGEELGIPLVDHIVIGDGRYVSMKDRGLF